MLEGPFHSRRWLERLQSITGLLELVFSSSGLVYLTFLGYGFWLTGETVKLIILIIGTMVLALIVFFIIRLSFRN